MHVHVYVFGDLSRNWRNCFTLIDAHVVSTKFSLITAGTVIIYILHCLVSQTPYIIECITFDVSVYFLFYFCLLKVTWIFFFKLYAFILLTSTLVPGIN